MLTIMTSSIIIMSVPKHMAKGCQYALCPIICWGVPEFKLSESGVFLNIFRSPLSPICSPFSYGLPWIDSNLQIRCQSHDDRAEESEITQKSSVIKDYTLVWNGVFA